MALKSLWIDEAYSVITALQPLTEIPEYLSLKDCHPPLYYFILHFWISVFGYSENSTRALSFTFYCLMLPAVYALARHYLPRRSALYAVCLAACSPLALGHANNVRMYSLLGLFSALILLTIVKRCSPFLIALVGVAGLLTQYWFAFVFAAGGVLALLFYRQEIFRRYFLGAFLASIVFLGLWGRFLIPQLSGEQGTAPLYIAEMDQGNPLLGLLAVYGGGEALLLYGAVLGLAALRFVKPDREVSVGAKRAIRDGLTLTLVATFIPATISIFKPIFLQKVLIILVPSLALLLAGLLSICPLPLLSTSLCLGVLFLTGVKISEIGNRTAAEDDRKVMNYIIENGSPGDVIVAPGFSYVIALYYQKLLHSESSQKLVGYPKEIEEHPGWQSPRDLKVYGSTFRKEAEEIISSCRNDCRIFLLFGTNREIMPPLDSVLAEKSILENSVPLPGSAHTEIRVYRLQY